MRPPIILLRAGVSHTNSNAESQKPLISLDTQRVGRVGMALHTSPKTPMTMVPNHMRYQLTHVPIATTRIAPSTSSTTCTCPLCADP